MVLESLWKVQSTDLSGGHRLCSHSTCPSLRMSTPQLLSPQWLVPQWYAILSQGAPNQMPAGFSSDLPSFASVFSYGFICLPPSAWGGSHWESPGAGLRLTGFCLWPGLLLCAHTLGLQVAILNVIIAAPVTLWWTRGSLGHLSWQLSSSTSLLHWIMP